MLNIHAPSSGASNFLRISLVELKAQKSMKSIIVGDFKTTVFPIERSSGQKIKTHQN